MFSFLACGRLRRRSIPYPFAFNWYRSEIEFLKEKQGRAGGKRGGFIDALLHLLIYTFKALC